MTQRARRAEDTAHNILYWPQVVFPSKLEGNILLILLLSIITRPLTLLIAAPLLMYSRLSTKDEKKGACNEAEE